MLMELRRTNCTVADRPWIRPRLVPRRKLQKTVPSLMMGAGSYAV